MPRNWQDGRSVTIIDRIDQLDPSLFDQIEGGLASSVDLRSLLAIHAAAQPTVL